MFFRSPHAPSDKASAASMDPEMFVEKTNILNKKLLQSLGPSKCDRLKADAPFAGIAERKEVNTDSRETADNCWGLSSYP